MTLPREDMMEFARGLSSGEFSVDHLLEAFGDEEIVEQIVALSKTVEPSKNEVYNLV